MKLINRITPLLLAVETAFSSPLACPNATSGDLIYFDIRLDLDIGNASCSDEQQAEMYANFQNTLKLDNGTIGDQSIALLQGQLCGTDNNSTNRRLVLATSYSWTGRMTCRLCTSLGRRLRQHRRLQELNTTQEIEDLLTESQAQGLIDNFINQSGSCLYEQWDAVVHVNITKSSRRRPQLPCE